jgi:hypothetical protein
MAPAPDRFSVSRTARAALMRRCGARRGAVGPLGRARGASFVLWSRGLALPLSPSPPHPCRCLAAPRSHAAGATAAPAAPWPAAVRRRAQHCPHPPRPPQLPARPARRRPASPASSPRAGAALPPPPSPLALRLDHQRMVAPHRCMQSPPLRTTMPSRCSTSRALPTTPQPRPLHLCLGRRTRARAPYRSSSCRCARRQGPRPLHRLLPLPRHSAPRHLHMPRRHDTHIMLAAGQTVSPGGWVRSSWAATSPRPSLRTSPPRRRPGPTRTPRRRPGPTRMLQMRQPHTPRCARRAAPAWQRSRSVSDACRWVAEHIPRPAQRRPSAALHKCRSRRQLRRRYGSPHAWAVPLASSACACATEEAPVHHGRPRSRRGSRIGA